MPLPSAPRRAGIGLAAALPLAMLAAPLAGPAGAQTLFDGGRTYSHCTNDAARRAGPPPRTDPRPGDDLAMLERRRQAYEDRYYRALDDCLRDAESRRVRRN